MWKLRITTLVTYPGKRLRNPDPYLLICMFSADSQTRFVHRWACSHAIPEILYGVRNRALEKDPYAECRSGIAYGNSPNKECRRHWINQWNNRINTLYSERMLESWVLVSFRYAYLFSLFQMSRCLRLSDHLPLDLSVCSISEPMGIYLSSVIIYHVYCHIWYELTDQWSRCTVTIRQVCSYYNVSPTLWLR